MRALLSTFDSRGGVEPLAAPAVQLQQLGVEAVVSVPPDEEFAELLAGAGVPAMPFGESLRAMKAEAMPSEADLRRHVDGLIAAQFETVAAAAQGCDALVATGFPPSAAGARSATEGLGLHYVYASYQPTILPSPHHPPPTYANGPFPPGLIDNRVLWDLDAHNIQTLFGETLNTHRAVIGLPPLDNVRDYAFTAWAWLADRSDPGPVAAAERSRRGADRRLVAAGRPSAAGRVGGVPRRRDAAGLRRLRQHAHARLAGTSRGWPSRRSAVRAAGCCCRGAGPT